MADFQKHLRSANHYKIIVIQQGVDEALARVQPGVRRRLTAVGQVSGCACQLLRSVTDELRLLSQERTASLNFCLGSRAGEHMLKRRRYESRSIGMKLDREGTGQQPRLP